MAAVPDNAPTSAKEEDDRKIQKARMLVSMLGADFAKTSKHPFFRDLAETAIKPVPVTKLSKPEMSRALQKLVRHLADPKPKTSPPEDDPVVEDAGEETADMTPAMEDILKQHPVLIAKHLLTLPAQQRITVLRALPGRTARMVASYSAELKTTPDSH